MSELQMIGVAGNQLWHTIRHADGSWQPSFGLVEGQESNNPGPFGAISCAGVGDELQMIGVAGNQLWHTIRHADGTDIACSATVDLSPSVTGLYGYRTSTATLHFGTLPGASVPDWK